VRMRRRMVAIALSVPALFMVLALAGAPKAAAHPLGNFTVNRYSGLILSPGHVRITYVLDMAEIPTAQEMPAIDDDSDGRASPTERQAWADRSAPRVAAHVNLSVDGAVVPLAVVARSMAFRGGQAGLPILRLVVTLAGDLPEHGNVVYEDRNYAARIGWKEVTARSQAGLAISGATVPAASVSRELLAYPTNLLQSPLDISRATFSFSPGRPRNANGPAVKGPTVSGSPIASGGGFASLALRGLTPIAIMAALGLAFLFGAGHALLPGHGKTITAAYMVGSDAKRRTAVIAGAAVAVMHTVSVLAIGLLALLIFRDIQTDRIFPWLTVLTGAVAIGLGGWLFLRRVRARRLGQDPWLVHGHSHGSDGGNVEHGRGHHHPHRGGHGLEGEPAVEAGIGSRRGLAALAVAGGILPSPTAIVVLTSTLIYHRIGYGLALIAAFSVGLAAALIAVGTAAVAARAFAARRMHSRLAGVLPLVSAAVIVGFGLVFAVRGVLEIH
jgi:nickel/cobalt transporter (NicO) family protein